MANRNPELIKWAVERNLLPLDAESKSADSLHHRSRQRLLNATRILDEIAQSPGINTEELAKQSGFSVHTVLMHTIDLEVAGLIEIQEISSNGAPKQHYLK